jgi:hypothetical protein
MGPPAVRVASRHTNSAEATLCHAACTLKYLACKEHFQWMTVHSRCSSTRTPTHETLPRLYKTGSSDLHALSLAIGVHHA